MRVLVVGLVHFAVGIARLPGGLKRAGFEVGALCLADSYLAHTRHIDHLWSLTTCPGSLVEFFGPLRQAVAAWQPQIIIPGDDAAVQAFHRSILTGKLAAEAPALARLVRDSLGDPALYEIIEIKSQLVELARSLGIRTPAQVVDPGEVAAQAFAREHGFPVILKPDLTRAGTGVRICRSPEELAKALRKPPQGKSVFGEKRGFAVQRFVRGKTVAVAFSAAQGELLSAFAYESVRARPHETSPVSVARPVEADGFAEALRPLVARLDYTGFAGADFVCSDGTGEAYFVELNARPTPIVHLGRLFGADIVAAFRARLRGEPHPRPLDTRAHQITLFPQEWLGDPASPHLREGHHDVPWDDLPLLSYIMTNPRTTRALARQGTVK